MQPAVDVTGVLLLLLPSLLCQAVQISLPEQVVTTDHSFEWASPSDVAGGASVADELAASTQSGDSYVLFTGDTQYWYPCTAENYNCYVQTELCSPSNGTCKRAHGEYANKLQKQSLTALIRLLRRHTNVEPSSLVINGDLTDFGHQDELDGYHGFWTPDIDGVPVYPGLGNHDYANNINQCGFNHCAQRVLHYFTDYVRRVLRRSMHLGERVDNYIWKRHTGSLSYSWDVCAANNGSSCVHFVQLNNYPTYRTKFEFPLNTWTLLPSIEWLKADLKQTRHPVVINFHDFDTSFSDEHKRTLQLALQESGAVVLGVLFAHYHSSVGLHPAGRWCLAGRPVPLLYSGSVPANNYLLMRLRGQRVERIWAAHASNDRQTVLWPVHTFNRC